MLSPKTTAPALPISEYGIAHAEDVYTLAALINDQIKKGFQPSSTDTLKQMQFGDELHFVQVMVRYQNNKNLKAKANALQNRSRTAPTRK